MKNLTLLLIACGLIFAASPVSFDQNNTSVYTAKDMRPYIPKPIVIPIDEKAKADIQIAAKDMRPYIPKPIVIPIDEKAKADIQIAAKDMRPYIPKPIVIPIDEKAREEVQSLLS